MESSLRKNQISGVNRGTTTVYNATSTFELVIKYLNDHTKISHVQNFVNNYMNSEVTLEDIYGHYQTVPKPNRIAKQPLKYRKNKFKIKDKKADSKDVNAVKLPKYYSSSVVNPLNYANKINVEKKLSGSSVGRTSIYQPVNPAQKLFDAQKGKPNSSIPGMLRNKSMPGKEKFSESSNKKPKKSFNNWEITNFGDDKVNEKFRKLMGIKSGSIISNTRTEHPFAAPLPGDKTANFFQEQEAAYERARFHTHAQRGSGFGFS